ncbi:MAG: histidinol-phosphatase HisJ family protein [Eubacteriales bacterium]
MQDYHIHSRYSTDSKQDISDICKNAVQANIKEIAITDHIDIDYPYDADFSFDIDMRNAEIDKEQKNYPALAIKKGVEIGLMPKINNDYVNIIRSHPFDFVIASIHIVNGLDPYFPEFFKGKTKEQAYAEYLEATYEGIKDFDDYDVIGHIGYASRFFPGEDKVMRYAEHKDLLDSILKKVIKDGKGIEVNTKGIAGTGDTLPSESILRQYLKLGGERITLGSDAHIPGRVGDEIYKTAERLKAMGFKYYTSYTKREPKQIAL